MALIAVVIRNSNFTYMIIIIVRVYENTSVHRPSSRINYPGETVHLGAAANTCTVNTSTTNCRSITIVSNRFVCTICTTCTYNNGYIFIFINCNFLIVAGMQYATAAGSAVTFIVHRLATTGTTAADDENFCLYITIYTKIICAGIFPLINEISTIISLRISTGANSCSTSVVYC